MENITRRTLLGLGLAGLVGTGLVCTSKTVEDSIKVEETIEKPITLQEYEDAYRTIENLGLEIDEDHSMFRKGSKSLIVYLPDIHTIYYQEKQKKRIKMLDDNLDFDIIGLEGMSGEIDETKLKKIREEEIRFFDENTIERDRRGDSIEDSDSDEIKLQKYFNMYSEASHNFDSESDIFQEDFNDGIRKKGNARYKAFHEMNRFSSRTHSLIPRKDPFGNIIETPVLGFMLRKKYHSNNIRIDAPGLHYARDLETRARKFGIESLGTDSKASYISNACSVNDGVSKLEKHIGEFTKAFNNFKQAYDGVGTSEDQERLLEMEKKYNEFIGFFQSYVGQMKDFRDAQLEKLPVEISNSIIESDYDIMGKFHPHGDIILESRSHDWVSNSRDFRNVMLIGGAGHTETVFDGTEKYDCSSISLKPLEGFGYSLKPTE